ncbi:MAG: hypothetical protein O0W93_06505 [Methanocorpusculum sp.]|nr:hypothetical protein [Methanocorpusculum sp.]
MLAQSDADGVGTGEGGTVWKVVVDVSGSAGDDSLFLFKNRKVIPEGLFWFDE